MNGKLFGYAIEIALSIYILTPPIRKFKEEVLGK